MALSFKAEIWSSAYFIKFQTMIERVLDKKIKMIQSDLGEELRSFLPYLTKLDIQFRHPCPHLQLQNWRFKKKNRHIVEVGSSLLAQAKCL